MTDTIREDRRLSLAVGAVIAAGVLALVTVSGGEEAGTKVPLPEKGAGSPQGSAAVKSDSEPARDAPQRQDGPLPWRSRTPTGDPVRDAFDAYTDAHGLVELDFHPETNIDAGNGLLHTGEKYVYLRLLGKLRDGKRDDAADLCDLYRRLKVAAGLINKNPRPEGARTALTSWDDYVGILAGACAVGDERTTAIAREILMQGKATEPRWIYDNTGKAPPGALFGRAPWYVAHFHFCAREDLAPPLGPLYEEAWALFMADPRSNERDGWILQWLMYHSLPDDASLLCRAAARSWLKEFRKKYPKGIGEVMAEYFKDPRHPMRVHAPPPERDERFGSSDVEEFIERLTGVLLRQISAVIKRLVAAAETAAEDLKVVWADLEAGKIDVEHARRTAQHVVQAFADVHREVLQTATELYKEIRQTAKAIREKHGLPMTPLEKRIEEAFEKLEKKATLACGCVGVCVSPSHLEKKATLPCGCVGVCVSPSHLEKKATLPCGCVGVCTSPSHLEKKATLPCGCVGVCTSLKHRFRR